MSTTEYYTIPPSDLEWNLQQDYTTSFQWEYQDGREALLNLYEKGKTKQWNASERIDWSQELDPENPEQMPDESMPIFGSPPYERMTEKEKVEARTHFQAWQLSQFMHGEQGALICTAKIVQQVPSIMQQPGVGLYMKNSSSPTRSRPP